VVSQGAVRVRQRWSWCVALLLLVPLLSAVEGVPSARATTTTTSTDALVTGLTATGLQSNTSIAVNAAATVVIAGYDDARGFPAVNNADQNTLSLSGVARSTDGGASWTPVAAGANGEPRLPTVQNGSVYGDASVVYSPVSDVFVYASVYVRPSDRLQGLSVSVSNSGATAGTVWSTPREVTPSFISSHAADKEQLTVNTRTGRLLVTWSDFGPSTTIRSSFSDDGGSTWSPATSLATTTTGLLQASAPAFLPAATNATSTAYVVWRDGTSTTRNIGATRSTDGGATWAPAVDIDSASYPVEDQVVGVDRVNTNPAIAVDSTSGEVYVVYQRNNVHGTGDIALRRWTGPAQAGTPVLLDADPGADRAQVLPWVAVDQSTQHVHVGWLDQGRAATGDLLDVMHTTSTDQGASWSPPTAVNDRPFHAGYGNDTGQPNMGDYNGAVAQGGILYTLWAGTDVQPLFDEGLPALGLSSPDVYATTVADTAVSAPLRTGTPTFTTGGAENGYLDPGETASLTVPLVNYVQNATTGAATITGISATLSTSTAGVTVPAATSSYPDLAPLASGSNVTPFQITLSDSFVSGTPIDLTLATTTAQGTASSVVRLETGTPVPQAPVLQEDFESVTVPAVPNTWTAMTGGGTADPWVTSATFTGSKAAFHDNDGTAAEWMRLWSPVVTIPPSSGGETSYVALDFDLQYRLEADSVQDVLAYDGLTLRIADLTGGQLLRSVLAEAFATSIKTGTADGFPRHLPRNNNANYFQDMSVWSGDSGGLVHVSMRLPAEGLVGRDVQLRFEYTEDATGSCPVGPCGIAVDNVVMRRVDLIPPVPATATTTTLAADPPGPVQHGSSITLTASVSPAAAAGTVQLKDNGVAFGGPLPVTSGTAQTTFAPADGSHSFTAEFTPTDPSAYAASTSAAVPFLVDATPPTVQLTSKPANPTASRSAHLAFTGTDASPPVTFTCKVDAAAAAPCTSPVDLVSLPDGVHTFVVTGHDAVGNASAPLSWSWRVDGTAPTVTLKTPTSLFVLGSSLPVSWGGADAGSGIAKYKLRYERAAWNGGYGAWTYPSSWQALTATSLAAPMAPGYTYCFSVQSVDKAGNASAWSGARCTARPLDDRSLSAATTGWSRLTSSSYYLGTYTSSKTLNARLTRTGAALDRVALVATRCSTCGTVAVYVGSTLIGNISLYSATTQRMAVLALPRFSLRSGTITIKVLTSSKTVQVDGLGISRA
jgi:hypothetical protein